MNTVKTNPDLIALRERQSIGRDLHDGLGQEIAGAMMILGSVLKGGEDVSTAVRADLAQVLTILRESISTCRSIAHGAAPLAAEPGGLVAALKTLGSRIQCRHKIEIQLRTRGVDLNVNDTTADQLFRIAQEAVTNAMKHGNARHIVISLCRRSNRMALSITDDGTGFDVAASHQGAGLQNMRYRASQIGAVLEIKRLRYGGTQVLCRRVCDG